MVSPERERFNATSTLLRVRRRAENAHRQRHASSSLSEMTNTGPDNRRTPAQKYLIRMRAHVCVARVAVVGQSVGKRK